eukprot:gnl/Spiro4/16872_TR9085_c0_g1_i1.p1 gnl/Spiro4/16872_TR9085_c0_g1~~gnl/Spiro4/16872_TR9085_c0_g1_i1.p1  ORF type:complete len:396 (-),score=72.74 gnl/Spiro4/16872_TR9085_c0_g1_i1:154-1341(-)
MYEPDFKKRPERVHGFVAPLFNLQIGSWVAYGILNLGFFVIDVPAMTYTIPTWNDYAPRLTIGLIYGFLSIMTVISCAVATRIDPHDPHHRYRVMREDGSFSRDPPPIENQDRTARPAYCDTCDINIPERTKHCKLCNKCVAVFDHHCLWLNTCIGAANYKWFFTCISSVTLMTLMQLSINIYLIIKHAMNNTLNQSGYGSPWYYEGFVVGEAIYIVIDIAALSQLLQLWFLHIYLVCRNLTTYQHIMMGREEMARKAQLKAARQEAKLQAQNQRAQERPLDSSSSSSSSSTTATATSATTSPTTTTSPEVELSPAGVTSSTPTVPPGDVPGGYGYGSSAPGGPAASLSRPQSAFASRPASAGSVVVDIPGPTSTTAAAAAVAGSGGIDSATDRI